MTFLQANHLVGELIDCIYVIYYCETDVSTINCELNVILSFLGIFMSVNAVQLPVNSQDITGIFTCK